MQNKTVPQVSITNEILSAALLLPDPDQGYYRGTRFDWSGVIRSLRFGRHEYFGPWYDKYDPSHHDCIMGPVDAFLPIGYDQARPGERFLMIGVGILERVDERPWEFVRTYPMRNGGKWSVSTRVDQVQMTHILEDAALACRYSKTVALVPGRPVMRISHRLDNTGVTPLQTLSYNHNFFVIDQQSVGAGYEAGFPRPITGQFETGAGLVDVAGRRFTLRRKFEDSESIFCVGIGGQDPAAPGYAIHVGNSRAGAAVAITCDRPAVRVDFWANPRTFCPEPYVEVAVAPGAAAEWTIQYEFRATDA